MQSEQEHPTSKSQAQHEMWALCLDPVQRKARQDAGKSVPPMELCAAFLMADKRKGLWQGQ